MLTLDTLNDSYKVFSNNEQKVKILSYKNEFR